MPRCSRRPYPEQRRHRLRFSARAVCRIALRACGWAASRRRVSSRSRSALAVTSARFVSFRPNPSCPVAGQRSPLQQRKPQANVTVPGRKSYFLPFLTIGPIASRSCDRSARSVAMNPAPAAAGRSSRSAVALPALSHRSIKVSCEREGDYMQLDTDKIDQAV